MSKRTGLPESRVDVQATVGQFLNDLSLDDLVVELVQNELDAGSTKTSIRFGPDALTCEGNGTPIASPGWDRLSYVMGAGEAVEAKQGGIGAKNHGLRSAFLLGDTVTVQSGGQQIELTVRGDSSDPSRFYAGVWPLEDDPSAPGKGTRVTVPYRRSDLTVPSGERPELRAVTEEDVRRIYESALDDAPSRFIAASAPGQPWTYELELSWLDEPPRLLTFTCRPRPGEATGLFRRTCKESAPGAQAEVRLRQDASPFQISLPSGDTANVPNVYRRGRRVYGELSWGVNLKGVPVPGTGAVRYPIGYPVHDQRSGHGFDISGPFISGRARHAMSEAPRNSLIWETAFASFARLLRRTLLPMYGAQALRLFSSDDYTDAHEEDRLVQHLLDARALLVVRPPSATNPRKLSEAIPRASGDGWSVAIACPSFEPDEVSSDLAHIAMGEEDALHPDTPRPLVAALQRNAPADSRLRSFNERDAAEAVLMHRDAPARASSTPAAFERCRLTLSVLDEAARRGALDRLFVADLVNRGLLPTERGPLAPWRSVRRARGPVPHVPGVPTPDILDRRLNGLALLMRGTLKVDRFDLDEYASSFSFDEGPPDVREEFFRWLRKSHSALKPSTLAEVAEYPVWPGRDGEHRPLATYCWPSSKVTRSLLAEVRIPPASSVVSFPGLRRRANGALVLRKTPEEEELRDWYQQRAVHALELYEAGAPEAAQAYRVLDEDLEHLRVNGYRVDRIALDHRTISQAGSLERADHLHLATKKVRQAVLLARDLLPPGHRSLYKALRANAEPRADALLRAMKEDPDGALLFVRLAAFRSTGTGLERLSDEPVVPVGDHVIAPNQLAFPGRDDLWGDWKTTLNPAPDVPEHVSLLERIGVLRPTLQDDLSQDFFEWLSEQPTRVQYGHLDQIVRHWKNRKSGPSRWWAKHPRIACLPVLGRDRVRSSDHFELVDHSAATHSRAKVYIPDFRELQDLILADNPSFRLAVTEAPRVGESVVDTMRAAGVRSLRGSVGRPGAITYDEVRDTDPRLVESLRRLQSTEVLGTLKRRLPRYHVPLDALRHNWKILLAGLSGVVQVLGPRAVYKVARRSYPVPVAGGVDAASSIVVIDASSDDATSRFFDAVADYVFGDDRSPLWAYGLRRAVEDSSTTVTLELADDREPDDEDGGGGHSTRPPQPPKKAHGIDDGRLSPKVPNPQPLSKQGDRDQRDRTEIKRRGRRKAKASTDDLRRSVEEHAQIQELKEGHYAWHCQACLGKYDVLAVTPPDSYLYLDTFRREAVQAHHVDHLQNEGETGARNILILCKYHHRYLGDRLSRSLITSALAQSTPALRRFPEDPEGSRVTDREGLLATVSIEAAPFEVKLFFTHEHGKEWAD